MGRLSGRYDGAPLGDEKAHTRTRCERVVAVDDAHNDDVRTVNLSTLSGLAPISNRSAAYQIAYNDHEAFKIFSTVSHTHSTRLIIPFSPMISGTKRARTLRTFLLAGWLAACRPLLRAAQQSMNELDSRRSGTAAHSGP